MGLDSLYATHVVDGSFFSPSRLSWFHISPHSERIHLENCSRLSCASLSIVIP